MGDYKTINIRNKRATFDYEILEEFVAGVVLVGTEIKSVRLGKASMVDSYCYRSRTSPACCGYLSFYNRPSISLALKRVKLISRLPARRRRFRHSVCT